MGKLYASLRHLFKTREQGNIIIYTLIFMVLGSLVIFPLLAFMGTGLKTGAMYNVKSDALYAADAGIEDGMWQIKYDRLNGTFAMYDTYDFNSTGWTYNLTDDKKSTSKRGRKY